MRDTRRHGDGREVCKSLFRNRAVGYDSGRVFLEGRQRLCRRFCIRGVHGGSGSRERGEQNGDSDCGARDHVAHIADRCGVTGGDRNLAGLVLVDDAASVRRRRGACGLSAGHAGNGRALFRYGGAAARRGKTVRAKVWIWNAILASAALILGIATAGPASAQQVEPRPSSIKVDVSLGAWISTGDTRWSHNASSSPPLGNPTSRLTYTDHTANVTELTVKLTARSRWFGRLNFGYADIGGGRLTDDDFLVQDGGNPSLRTHSDIKSSSMYYINAEAGGRILNYPNGRGALDGIVGFQYWHEEHNAYGVRQVSCSTAGSTVDLGGGTFLCPVGTLNSSILAITNVTSWYSLRAGLETEYRLTRWFSIRGMGMLKPLSVFDNRDTHRLRRDVFQDPSFTMYGIGMGADADAGVKFYLTKSVSIDLGYRVWWNRMVDGNWKNHLNNGSSETFPLTQFQTIRHGATFGLTASF